MPEPPRPTRSQIIHEADSEEAYLRYVAGSCVDLYELYTGRTRPSLFDPGIYGQLRQAVDMGTTVSSVANPVGGLRPVAEPERDISRLQIAQVKAAAKRIDRLVTAAMVFGRYSICIYISRSPIAIVDTMNSQFARSPVGSELLFRVPCPPSEYVTYIEIPLSR